MARVGARSQSERVVASGASGGHVLTCGFTAPVGPSTPSSVDIFGATQGPAGNYIAAAMPYPAVGTIEVGGGMSGSQPLILFGIPNNGSAWGIQSGVNPIDPASRVRWVWDTDPLGRPLVCTAWLNGELNSSPYATIVGSDDGASWTTVVDNVTLVGAGSAPITISPAVRYRYWAILYDALTPSGFYAGETNTGFLLWAAR